MAGAVPAAGVATDNGGAQPTPTEEPRRFAGGGASQGTSGAAEKISAELEVLSVDAKKTKPPGPKRFIRQAVPDEILHDAALNDAIAVLPANYNFEVHKTVWRLRKEGVQAVALQFPEGLLMYSCILADVFRKFGHVKHVFVLGDVTFGACCIDDLSAAALGADFLVHYGHSCLVPVDATTLPCMYVFVDIKCDVGHLVATVRLNFEPHMRLILAGTIQFASSMQEARVALAETHPNIVVPQAKPLSPGEVLGCTAPALPNDAADFDALLFVADGRFHLEAMMIANPSLPAYRYDPYARVITREEYDQVGMRAVRRRAVEAAKGAKVFGVVMGTLGRQGNPRIVEQLCAELEAQGREHVVVLLSEISPQKLAMMRGVDAWVQVACPRLSIDWGEGFALPTLTPYEAWIALGKVPGFWERERREGDAAVDPYPMDYYDKAGGEWNSSYHRNSKPARRREAKPSACDTPCACGSNGV
mmetsp:Transcript_11747/g.21208  ORF Transcript_11747/g.21208 Transcript_11747/m.21208 type:complete len:475 (-) Transcript_11747:115-1539(-)